MTSKSWHIHQKKSAVIITKDTANLKIIVAKFTAYTSAANLTAEIKHAVIDIQITADTKKNVDESKNVSTCTTK